MESTKSTAKLKIIVGHCAIRSAGHHGDTKELTKWLGGYEKAEWDSRKQLRF